MKNKGGRPRKLTLEMKSALVDGIEKGLTLKAACKCAGVSYSSLANWKRFAKAENEGAALYKDLIVSITVASHLVWFQHRQQALSLITREDLKFRQPPKVYLTKKQREEQNITSLIERIAALEKKKAKGNFSGALVGHSEIKNHDK